MDLHDTGATVKYLIRDRDIKYTTALYAGFQNEGIATVKTGIRVPRMNAIKERWMRACRAELHDRTLTCTSPNFSTRSASTSPPTTNTGPTAHSAPWAPLHPLRRPITEPDRLDHLDNRRRDRPRRHPPRVPTCRLTWSD